MVNGWGKKFHPCDEGTKIYKNQILRHTHKLKQ
jgi:hypothetical protein